MSVKTWGDFEIQLDRVLGKGGMGAVYLGRQVSVDRPAAIKVLSKELTQSPEFVKRFHREASLLARLTDPHVVQVFGAGMEEGFYFYAMEFVEGEDLGTRIKRGHAFSMSDILQVAQQVGRALQAAWRHRVIHRDIKPSNIIVTPENIYKVTDFGLAKNAETELTQSQVIMGTAKYMSPEQATGRPLDIRSDLYSLGVILYELATGRPPFTGESPTSVMYQHVHEPPKPPREINPKIPEEIQSLILRLMAKSPEVRHPSPEALVSAVQGLMEGVTPDERSTLFEETLRAEPLAEKTPAPRARSRALPLAVSLLAALVVIGAGGYFLFQEAKAPPRKQVAIPKPPPSPVVEKDPSPSVEPPSSWEETRRRGIEAFGARQWVAAYTTLEEAARLGAPDVEQKIRRARGNELIEKGEAESEEEKALEHFRAAQACVDDEEIRVKITRTSFRRWKRSAERSEGVDWSQAAADWARALEHVEDSHREEIESRRRFCSTFADAMRARTNQNWTRALELFRELGKDPRAYVSVIEEEIRKAEGGAAGEARESRRRLEEEFTRLSEEAARAFDRAAWKEADEILRSAEEPRFGALSRSGIGPMKRQVREALAAPPGMVYVVAGTFTMGGSRGVEGPPGDALTSAFYIDVREVSVAEYGEFLRAIEGKGHHPGCPQGEPSGKSHVPDAWGAQKGGDSVAGVDWWDAASYAAWKGKRLPAEAEWEKAAGFEMTSVRVYPWGNDFKEEGGASFFGSEGMGSGVIEWTAEWFKRYPWSRSDHPEFGERKRVLRGGVLLQEDAARDARVSHRFWYLPSYRSRRVGFRCVQDIPVKPDKEER